MKFKKKEFSVNCEPDMTPMIDMTFQLIAFFMVLLNFGEGEQDERIKLPYSALAKPPEAATDSPIVLQLTEKGTVLFCGEELPLAQLTRPLARERKVLELGGKGAADATIKIRADGNTKTGVVQEVIQKCQAEGFEKFSLRAKQEQGT